MTLLLSLGLGVWSWDPGVLKARGLLRSLPILIFLPISPPFLIFLSSFPLCGTCLILFGISDSRAISSPSSLKSWSCKNWFYFSLHHSQWSRFLLQPLPLQALPTKESGHFSCGISPVSASKALVLFLWVSEVLCLPTRTFWEHGVDPRISNPSCCNRASSHTLFEKKTIGGVGGRKASEGARHAALASSGWGLCWWTSCALPVTQGCLERPVRGRRLGSSR